jgi:hypothetical protein
MMMMMDADDTDADDHDIIYVINVTYIKAWAAGVGEAPHHTSSHPTLIINDDVSVSLNSSMNDGDGCKWWWWM